MPSTVLLVWVFVDLSLSHEMKYLMSPAEINVSKLVAMLFR